MIDPRFYEALGPVTVRALAPSSDIGGDPERLITGAAAADRAGPADLCYFEPGRKPVPLTTAPGACVLSPAHAHLAANAGALILSNSARATFAKLLPSLVRPRALEPSEARVHPKARLEEGVIVMPGAVIGANAQIGAGSEIGANAVIGPGVILGSDCRIGANATLMYCLVGERVVVHPGVCIGQDGFGFVMGADGHKKVPQLGRVIIGDDVEIGANSTVDRGAMSDTVIGAGTKIDNLVQIAHNVQIGERCVLVSQCGVAGSARIGNGVVIGGQVGVVSHVQIGDGAQIAGKAGVMRDIAPGEVVMGYPAKPIRQFWREIAALSRLTKRDKTP